MTVIEYGVIAVTLVGIVFLGGTVIGQILQPYGKSARARLADGRPPVEVKIQKIGGLETINDKFTAGAADQGWGIVNEIQGWTGPHGIEVQDIAITNPARYPGNSDFVFESDGHSRRPDRFLKTYDQFTAFTDVQISFQIALRNHPNTREGSDGVNVYWNGKRVRTVHPKKSGWRKITINVNTSDGYGSGILMFRDRGNDDGVGTYIGDITVSEVVR